MAILPIRLIPGLAIRSPTGCWMLASMPVRV
jgi:hypothetical protein